MNNNWTYLIDSMEVNNERITYTRYIIKKKQNEKPIEYIRDLD